MLTFISLFNRRYRPSSLSFPLSRNRRKLCASGSKYKSYCETFEISLRSRRLGGTGGGDGRGKGEGEEGGGTYFEIGLQFLANMFLSLTLNA